MADQLYSPNENDAVAAIECLTGEKPASIERFKTGNHHYVYDVTLTDGQKVVARLANPTQKKAMVSAAYWSDVLRPRGIPLPEIIGRGLDRPFPCLILERFSGVDLWQAFPRLSKAECAAITAQLVDMQSRVEELGLGIRYGYAANAKEAKSGSWADVVTIDLRNRELLPDLSLIMEQAFATMQPLLRQVKPTPFLHDTTTKNVIINDANALSGIVDVDDLCWGDRRFTKALTLVAILADGYDSTYVDQWMKQAGDVQDCLFDLYAAHHAFSFLGEAMRPVGNGNPNSQEPERMARLEQLVRNRCEAVMETAPKISADPHTPPRSPAPASPPASC